MMRIVSGSALAMGLGLALAPSSAAAQQACDPAGTLIAIGGNEGNLRHNFQRSDRVRTADAGKLAAMLAAKCLERAGDTAPSAADRKRADEAVRQYFRSLGYRPSNDPPPPGYVFCVVHFNYDPPRYHDYYNIYFLSAIVQDPHPDSYADAKNRVTRVQQGLHDRLVQFGHGKSYSYAAHHSYDDGKDYPAETVTLPTDIDDPMCFAGDTLADAQQQFADELDNLGGEAVKTDIR